MAFEFHKPSTTLRVAIGLKFDGKNYIPTQESQRKENL